jgi:hypothetical protein
MSDVTADMCQSLDRIDKDFFWTESRLKIPTARVETRKKC